MITGVATAPLTARALGVEDRGTLALILLASAALTAVGSFGLGWLARDDVAKDRSTAPFWRSFTNRVMLLFLPIAIASGVLVSSALNLGYLEHALTVSICMLSASSAARSVDGNILVSSGKAHIYGATSIAASSVVFLAIIGTFVLGHLSLSSAIAANIAGVAVQVLLLRWLGIRGTSSEGLDVAAQAKRTRENPDYQTRKILARSMRSWRAQIGEVVTTKVDVLLAAHLTQARTVGYYSVVAILPQLAYAVLITLVQRSFGLAPRLSAGHRLSALAWSCLYIAFSLVLIAMPAAWYGIPIVFGPDFAPARELLPAGIAVVFGLSSAVPVLQDAARRAHGGRIFAGALLLAIVIGLTTAFWFPGLTSITAFGVVLFLAGWAYVFTYGEDLTGYVHPCVAIRFIRNGDNLET